MAPRFVAGERTPSLPSQARSIATRARLLDAAEQLLRERGYEDTSVSQIVQAAHSSVGVFYQRFSDKTEIARAVQERLQERLHAMWSAALEPVRWQDAGLEAIVTGAVIDLARFMDAEAPLIRVFALRALVDDTIRLRVLHIGQLLVAPLTALLLLHRDEIAHPQPPLAIETGFRMVYATLQQTALYGSVRPTHQPASSDQLTGELVRAYLAYLTR